MGGEGIHGGSGGTGLGGDDSPGYAVVEEMKNVLGEGIQRGKNVIPGSGSGFKNGQTAGPGVEEILHVGDGGRIREVAFVELEDSRELVKGGAIVGEITDHAVPGREVFLHAVKLGVRDENDPIDTPEHHLSGGVIANLPRDRIEHELCFVAIDHHRVDGQEVEEESPVVGGGEGHQVTPLVSADTAVDIAEIGGLAAHGSAAIDQLETDLAGIVVDDGHGRRKSGKSGRR